MEIKEAPKEVFEELQRRGYNPESLLKGYFVIKVDGRELGRGSGIAGDDRWFWYDTKLTAKWSEFPRVQ